MEILSILRGMEDFKEVPVSQLQWLIDRGELLTLEPGDHLFKPGDPIDTLLIILEGSVVLKVQQGNQFRIISTFEQQSISGLLPYSRASESKGYALSTLPTTVLQLHVRHFREMIVDHEVLTTALVHKMSSRIRQFTRFEQQNDKMMALGKLSAGLAHELNNPSAAIIRSSQSLDYHLSRFPTVFRSLIKTQMTDQQVETINERFLDRLSDKNDSLNQLSMMERSRREDRLLEWLEPMELENPEEVADNLIAFDFTADELEKAAANIPSENWSAVLTWINQMLKMHRLVAEITDASNRIHKLVSSVKNYTHMDQAPEKKVVDIHEGLENTLTMLNHKLKKGGIAIQKEYHSDLKQPEILVNEMNQVWTNLIDNAIDAMENAEQRQLTIRTTQDDEYVYVYIGDTGSGIPEEVQDKIFDPFFTTKTIGKGTGLGMEVVQQIVSQHHGSVTFETRPGKTEFKVCLPIH